MARIQGHTPGLVPMADEPPPPVAPKPAKQEPEKVICTICGGEIVDKRKRAMIVFEDGQCRHCEDFFGSDRMMRGCTNFSPEKAAEECAKAGEYGWVMILREQHLGAPGGRTVSLELGDVMKVSRSGYAREAGLATAARTRQMFMIEVTVGNIPVTLYPHEFSPISFTTIMELKRDGEIEEQFVTAGDETGYFAPTPDMRRQIRQAFGPRN